MKHLAWGCVLFLAGCGWIPDRTLVYQQAEPVEPMEVPEDLEFTGAEPLYPLPGEGERMEYTGERFTPPRPPQLEVVRRDRQTDSPRPIRPDAGRALLTRDGNNHPIIMLPTEFSLAWEQVDAALAESPLRVRDRNREAGIFFLRVPREKGVPRNEVQLKLSHTVNGIQVAVLTRDGASLAARDVSTELLETLHGKL